MNIQQRHRRLANAHIMSLITCMINTRELNLYKVEESCPDYWPGTISIWHNEIQIMSHHDFGHPPFDSLVLDINT